MRIKIKKLNDSAVLPMYSTEGAAGMDMTAINIKYDNEGNVVYGTGIAVEIPKGYVGLLFPRSSNAKKRLLLSNSVGVIDSDYRGEITLKFKRLKHSVKANEIYTIGDRVGQLIILPYPRIEWQETKKLSETKRGINGYGYTGR